MHSGKFPVKLLISSFHMERPCIPWDQMLLECKRSSLILCQMFYASPKFVKITQDFEKVFYSNICLISFTSNGASIM